MKARAAAALVLLLCGVEAAIVGAAPRPDLSGTWTLNRALSEFPREVGFDPDWHDAEGGGQAGARRSGGGRGSRSGGGSTSVGSVSPIFESEEDSRKIRELVNEVKQPPDALTIVQTDAAVKIAGAGGAARTFHTGGKDDTLELDAGPVSAIARWENGQLLIRCLVEKNRELRYRYSLDPGARQLVVEVQFADHGRGQLIKRTYDIVPPR